MRSAGSQPHTRCRVAVNRLEPDRHVTAFCAPGSGGRSGQVSLPIHPVPTQSEGTARRLPVNVFATTTSTVVVAPLPGVMAEHVQVVVSDRQVTITAERDVDGEHDYLLHEWNAKGFERTIDLPDDVGWPITAAVANGQLTITLARRGTRPDDESITIVPTAARQGAALEVGDVIDLRQAEPAD
jgi:HSP20 family molecular chaperone IbpA